jgi:hypothetical protein
VDSPLVQQPYDKFWDGSPSRREMQKVFNKLATNDSELMGMADTAALLINYILERKLGVTNREDIDIYVEAKKLQLAEAREKMKAVQEAQVEQPNG